MARLNGIGSIPKDIFKRSKVADESKNKVNEAREARTTNPFGVSFNGKMITADVFEKAKSKNELKLTERISQRSKLISSAIVGSISGFTSGITARLNSIANFGRKIRQNVIGFWENAKNTELSLNMHDLKNMINLRKTESPKELAKKPVNELEVMLTDCIAELSGKGE